MGSESLVNTQSWVPHNKRIANSGDSRRIVHRKRNHDFFVFRHLFWTKSDQGSISWMYDVSVSVLCSIISDSTRLM